jgi:hypothetical protein
MPKKRSTPKKLSRKSKPAVVIGGRRFAKISAVEGIVLTGEMRTRIAEFDLKGMSAEERRRSIIRAYRKA